MPAKPTLYAVALLISTKFLLAEAPLTLQQAVEAAAKNYPSIRVSQEQINAAAAGIRLARTSYLPRIDALAVMNRATRNNVFGILLPQSVIPSMSGPVLGTNNLGTAWGSAVGGLVRWEPFDFGLRQANVGVAEATRVQSEASLKRTQFEVTTATLDSYLTLAAAQETTKAAQAGVDRADAVVRTTHAQVNAQLRPGADSSRAEAERAAAQTQLIQARQAVEVARAALAQFVAVDPAQIVIDAPGLLQLPPERAPEPVDFRGESDYRRAKCHRGSGPGSTAGARAFVFSEVRAGGRCLCARHRRRTQRRTPGRVERLSSQRSELRRGFQRDFPDHGFGGDARA